MTKCNLCGNTVFLQKYTIYKFHLPFSIMQCNKCGLIFQYPQPEHANELYNKGYYKGEAEYSYIDEREDKFLRYI